MGLLKIQEIAARGGRDVLGVTGPGERSPKPFTPLLIESLAKDGGEKGVERRELMKVKT